MSMLKITVYIKFKVAKIRKRENNCEDSTTTATTTTESYFIKSVSTYDYSIPGF